MDLLHLGSEDIPKDETQEPIYDKEEEIDAHDFVRNAGY